MMKKVKILGLCFIALFFFAGSAVGYQITVLDPDSQTGAAANWPGYYSPPGVGYSHDTYGTPHISSMTATIDNVSNYLVSVELSMDVRQVNYDYKFDSLFINADMPGGEPYEKWNYYIKGNLSGEALYDVSGGYSYVMAYPGYPRVNHPAGIDVSGMTPTAAILSSITWDGGAGTLTYNFIKGKITMGNQFAIGYSEWCANDVVLLEKVPEPGSMLLLGLGILGVGIFGRKRTK